MRKLRMELPEGFVEALNRRHNGRTLPNITVKDLIDRMETHYTQYKKACKNLEKLDIFWDEKKVESFFQEPIWYNAHSRLKKYNKLRLDAWKRMFYTLLQADGNNEPFDQYNCISAEEIYEDFCGKYKKEGLWE